LRLRLTGSWNGGGRGGGCRSSDDSSYVFESIGFPLSGFLESKFSFLLFLVLSFPFLLLLGDGRSGREFRVQVGLEFFEGVFESFL